MEKIVKIGDREVKMRASALIPRLYRRELGRDMVSDMRKLQRAYQRVAKDPDAQFDVLDLEIFENVAWIMLKHGGEDVGNTPDEWLDSLDGVFSIYEALPAVLELWGANTATTASPKKE